MLEVVKSVFEGDNGFVFCLSEATATTVVTDREPEDKEHTGDSEVTVALNEAARV